MVRRLSGGGLVLASALAVFAAEGSGTSTPEGLALLHKMQAALGGADKIASVRDYEETILAQAWDANGGALGEVRKRTRWIQSPSTLRLDQVGPRGTYVLFFDGGSDSGWELLPDQEGSDPYKTTGKPVSLAGGELEFARGYLSGFELNQWLADKRGYTVTAPKENVLRIEHSGKATDLTLDPATHLPSKDASVSLSDPNRPVPSEMTYGGWREVSGVRFATHRVKYLSGAKRGEVTTGTVKVNQGLEPQDLASKPADFAPELPPSLAGVTEGELMATAKRRSTATKRAGGSKATKRTVLSGGNPRIAKADGDAPVQAYIAAMPGWKHDVGRRLDALVVRAVPKVYKAVRWNSPFYGIKGQGWFLAFHVFTRYVKVSFFKGTSLRPVPPGGTGEEARWIDIHEDDLDEAQMGKWIRQAAAIPGWGRGQR